MNCLKNFIGKAVIFLLLVSVIIGPVSTNVAKAAIVNTDYFILTSAGNATTMDSGGTLVFTVQSKDGSNAANPLVGDDYAYVEIMGGGENWQRSTTADVTAVGGGISIKSGAVAQEGATPPANIDGANDNLVAINIDETGTGTFTVRATSSFNVFVWAQGALMNSQDSGGDWPDGGTPPGQAFKNITVNIPTTGADHLVAAAAASAEVNQTIPVTITQANLGGGTVNSALTDVGVTVSEGGTDGAATITTVNGEDIEDAASISNASLVSGVLNLTVKVTNRGTGEGAGTLTITPSSATLEGVDVADTVTISAVTAAKIKAYGPQNGQVGVPTMAPVDFFLDKNPDPDGAIFTNNELTNTDSSDFALVDAQGAAVAGSWHKFSESSGSDTMYGVSFTPSAPFASSSTYTAKVNKIIDDQPALQSELFGGMTALTSSDTLFSFSFTTGTGGGNFTGGGGGDGGPAFGGTMGGEFPPMANLGYPNPGSWDIPTNISCVSINFDRPMDVTTLTTSNIYLRKVVSGTEQSVSGTPVVTVVGSDNQTVCLSGYTLEASSKYRVVVTRSVKDTKGNQIAGMPESNGTSTAGFGFGFENMGPFREEFNTGTGSSTITASLMGTNLDAYLSSGSITGVPTGFVIRASFNQPLNASTVNSTNVTLKKNGSVPVAGNISYDAMGNSIEFFPSNVLAASSSYTFNISTSVQSISGTALSSGVTKTFTTGLADAAGPQLGFADADNYGIFMQFNEPLQQASAENKSYYTLKTCSGAAIASNGGSCTGGGSVTTVSLQSGVNFHYEKSENEVWADGLTLTPGDGFYVEIGSDVKDLAGNAIDSSNDTWTGTVMDGAKFEGGQGMFNMGTMGFEDFDMSQMGMRPVGAWPMNTMANATTKYFLDIPLSQQIPADGYIVLTYPAGFDVSGAKQDAQSPMNSDFNGPTTGTVTFDNAIPATYTDGVAGDGVGYITAARKVAIQLNAATLADDFLHIDIDGIKNASEPKDFDSAGYSVEIKTYNSSGVMLEALTTMPFFISGSGSNTVAGRITAGGTGINGAKVFLASPMTGPMEVTTSLNGAGDLVEGNNTGEYKFESLPAGQYQIWTEPTFTVGEVDYKGQGWPEPLTVDGAETKPISVTALDGTGQATQPVSITFGTLPTNLGFGDSIDIFAGGPGDFVVKTVSRATLGESPYTTNLYLPSAGKWFVGIGPAMPKGPMSKPPEVNWMPSKPTEITVAAADLGGEAKSSVSFSITASDKTITGKVVDGSGTAISNAEVYAYNPKQGMDAHATSATDGSFTLNVVEGNFKVGAFLPGMPNSQEVSVLVNGSSFYVDGSPTASTGTSGAAPFNLKISKPSFTIQGRISDGTNAISNASVWAHRTDLPGPPVNAITNSSGNYTLYVNAGTWSVNADAPSYGYLGSKTVTVGTESVTGQNFTTSSQDRGTISGFVCTTYAEVGCDDGGAQSGVMVWANGPSGWGEAKTNSSGAFSLNLAYGTYTLNAYIPGVGDLPPLTNKIINEGTPSLTAQNFTLGTTRTVTISFQDAATDPVTFSEQAFINFFGSNGKGNGTPIPAGNSSATLTLVDGTYNMDTFIPGVDFSALTITGAAYADRQITVDGAEAITITVPELKTVTGTVLLSGSGVSNAFVSYFNTSTKTHFGVNTGNDGTYTIKLPAGTYSAVADKPGYSSLAIDVTVSATEANSGKDLTLTQNSRTIQGTISSATGNIANAHVWAQGSGGSFASAQSGPDGTYTLSVKEGIYEIRAVGEGYQPSATALTANTTSANATGKNFTLTALTTSLNTPKTKSITPSSGGTVTDSDTNATAVIPPNALGSGSDAGSITTKETNAVISTATADPLGNGQVIEATDSSGNPITTLDSDVTFTLQMDVTSEGSNNDLTDWGVDTFTEIEDVVNSYWDDSTNNWVTLPTTMTFYNSSDVVIASSTVEAADTLDAANVSYVKLTSTTDHFTTFAPVDPSGATPPATPSGVVATAGNAQVALTWTANSEEDIASYTVWEANVVEGAVTSVTHASACTAGTCSYTHTGRTNGTALSYQIIAVDSDGNQSAGSSAVSATPTAPAASNSNTGSVIGGSGGSGTSKAKTTKEKSTETKDEDSSKEEVKTGEVKTSESESAVEDSPFEDVKNHWAKEFVSDLFKKGVVKGYDEKHFAPDKNITRAEFIKIVVESLDIPTLDASKIAMMPFKDVKKTDWYLPYAKAALQKRLVSGYEDGTFKGDKTITRGEALKILLEAVAAKVDESAKSNFPDVKQTEWYAPYVNYAAEKQIVNGYANGKFGPNNNLTRGEVAKIIVLILQSKVSAE